MENENLDSFDSAERLPYQFMKCFDGQIIVRGCDLTTVTVRMLKALPHSF